MSYCPLSVEKVPFYAVLGSVDVQVDTWENRNFWRTQADEKKPEKAILRGQHGPPCVATRPVLKSAWKVEFGARNRACTRSPVCRDTDRVDEAS